MDLGSKGKTPLVGVRLKTLVEAIPLWVHKLATAHPNFLCFIGYAIRYDTCGSPRDVGLWL